MKSLGPAVPELIILPVYSALPSEMQVRGSFCSCAGVAPIATSSEPHTRAVLLGSLCSWPE